MAAGSDLAILDFDFRNESPVSCFLCRDSFNVCNDPQPLLQHLLNIHKCLIGAPEEIADFRQYIIYWDKLRYASLVDYCIVYVTNSEPGAKELSETFYLLCDKLPEDNRVRFTIREMKLKYLMQQKEEEYRNKNFSRMCIYCQKRIEGGVANCFHHLTFVHGFSLGNPDNIVFGEKLLDVLEDKLKRLQCLYCEKTFRTHIILREHMRKKQHRSLNPKNKMYDKYYILNYLKPGIPWEEAKKAVHEEKELCPNHQDNEASSDEENLWTDWREDANIPATCLFCPFTTTHVQKGLMSHMCNHHAFNFEDITQTFSFYSKVKLINYIRTKVGANQCIGCQLHFPSNDELSLHMKIQSQCSIPKAAQWDHPQYLIPFVESDGLLLCLEDNDICDEDTSSFASFADEELVFPEDIPAVQSSSIFGDQHLREELSADVIGENNFTYQCFFCPFSKSGGQGRNLCICHMKSMHSFDYKALKTSDPKLRRSAINYIRLMTEARQCFVCHKSFFARSALEEHRTLEDHTSLELTKHQYNYTSGQSQISIVSDGFIWDET